MSYTDTQRHHSAEKARAEREYRFEEARRLMAWGVHPDRIAAQLDTTRQALSKLAERWGATDIHAYVRGARDRRTGTCACGAPMKARAARCWDCYTASRRAA